MANIIFWRENPGYDRQLVPDNEPRLQAEWRRYYNCVARIDYQFFQEHPELSPYFVITSERWLQDDWNRIRYSIGCRP